MIHTPPSTHEKKSPKIYQLFTGRSKSLDWTVNQILGADILGIYHSKPYAYFQKRGVTILDWKVLLSAYPELFIQKGGGFQVHGAKIQEFLRKWQEHLNNPKHLSPTDHVYLKARRTK